MMLEHRRAILEGLILVLSFAGGCSQKENPIVVQSGRDCIIAQVGPVSVTAGDAEMLRAVVQPPPTPGEARRLAVAVTSTFVAHNPGAQVPPIEVRFGEYRKALRTSAIAKTEAPAIFLGMCGADAVPGNFNDTPQSEREP
jgi:hypothetical protein